MKTISQLLFGFLMTLVLTVALVYAFDLDSAYSEKTEAAADCETVEPEVAEKEIEIKAAVLEEPEVIKTNQAAGSEDEKMADETEDNLNSYVRFPLTSTLLKIFPNSSIFCLFLRPNFTAKSSPYASSMAWS